MSRVLLLTINAKWIHPSLALRLLQANMGQYSEDASILEFALRQPMSEKISGIITAAPEILAISVSIWNHLQTLELLKELRIHWPQNISFPVIVLGGCESSYLGDDAELFDYADILIRGEGERSFSLLCTSLLQASQSLPVCDKLKNLESSFASGAQAIAKTFWRNDDHLLVVDSDPVDCEQIATAYHLYSDEDLQRKLVYVEASRGCPFGCEFCLSSLDRRVRTFPLESFLQDMQQLIDRGATRFKFLDRTFNLDIERAAEILEFFLQRLTPEMFVHFEMVPSRFPSELRPLLKQFPEASLRLEVGIQTFNPEVAARIGRQSNPECEIEALQFLADHTNAIVHADLIAGLPGEDYASFAAGFNRLWAAKPGEIQLGILKKLPGTPIARHDIPFGMRYDKEPPYEVRETAALCETELEKLKNFARFWELLVNRGHFDELLSRMLPDGCDAFKRFAHISAALLHRFGRNWGIDRNELRAALTELVESIDSAASE